MKMMNAEARKYLIRFGLIAALMVPILIWAQGPQAVKVITYKTCLVAGGIFFAEMVWAIFFKPVYGRSEEYRVPQSVFIFRGLLYGAIILAFTLGL